MTSALLTPWYHRRRRQRVVPTAQATGGVAETRILDHQARGVRQLTRWVAAQGAGTEADLVRQAHAAIGQRVRAVYAMNDQQPSSETLRRGRPAKGDVFDMAASVDAYDDLFGPHLHDRELTRSSNRYRMSPRGGQ